MRTLISAAALMLSLGTSAFASGCYICGNGSAPVCKNYCVYNGPDTFDNRHRCEAKGCRITGTSACPSSSNVTICQAPAAATPGTTVAALARPLQSPPR